MNEEKLKELGFALIDEYLFVDEPFEFITRRFRKESVIVDMDFSKNNGKFIGLYLDLGEIAYKKITFSELKQLDKILNK